MVIFSDGMAVSVEMHHTGSEPVVWAEIGASLLGTDKSRGYCLEMICADFLAGAHLDNGNPDVLLNSIWHYYKFLSATQKRAFFEQAAKLRHEQRTVEGTPSAT